jgi:hypothetical protein
LKIGVSKKNTGRLWTAIKGSRKRVILLLIFSIVTGYTAVVFVAGGYAFKTNFHMSIVQTHIPVMKRTLANFFNVSMHFADVDRIKLDIKDLDFKKIEYKRKLALEEHGQLLFSSDNDYVPAKISFNKKSLKLKIRLKGDSTDHLLGERWSFRAIMKGQNTLFGMKKFSLQRPAIRNYIHEWVYHKLLENEDVIALRYKFVHLTLNGKDLGPYTIEEFFDKRLVENRKRREGTTLRFNEDLFWIRYPLFHSKPTPGYNTYLSSDIDAFGTSQTTADPGRYDRFVKARSLLDAFRRGELKTSEVFDTKLLAWAYAVAHLLGADHATSWYNSRFYYNPITSKIEPIGFDAFDNIQTISEVNTSLGAKFGHYLNTEKPIYHNFYAMLFRDQAFYSEYISSIEKLARDSYLDSFYHKIGKELKANMAIIHIGTPSFVYPKELFYKRAADLRVLLNPEKGLHAFFYRRNKNILEIDVGNIQQLPLKIISASSSSDVFEPQKTIILPGKALDVPVQYQTISFKLPHDQVWQDAIKSSLKITYKVLGATPTKTVPIFSWPYSERGGLKNDLTRRPANADKFEFLTIDEKSKSIFFKNGRWKISQDLIIQSGYKVYGGAGLELDLVNSSTILSYSPFELIGTYEHPILIHSSDSTGQGLSVMNASKESVLDYVKFDNLGNPNRGRWNLTGAINFYKSPVTFSHVQFLNNRSEDCLNIIRSKFKIMNSHFSGIFSDALDVDYGKGEVLNSIFSGSGNDAIDISGGFVEVKNVTIAAAGDKGISAGEGAKLVVSEARVRNSEIAIASKDNSLIKISESVLNHNKVSYVVFQKKPEFGPGTIIATNVTIMDQKSLSLVETGSSLIIDGKQIRATHKNVKSILYGVEFGKSSK